MFNQIKNYISQHPLVSIVLVLVCILLFSTVFFTFSQTVPTQSPSGQQNTIKTHVIYSNSPTLPVVSTKTYSGTSYEVAFPQTWTQDTNTAAVYQNTMLSLQPKASNPQENAHVAVEINNTQDTSLARMSQGLSLLGFQRTNTTVAGVSAQKFTGTVTLAQKILHNIAYLFEYKNQIYLIKLSYQGSTGDPQLEQEFTQSIDSFRLN